MNFKNSVVLLTGASSGIGYQLAKDLSSEGARLALIARRTDILKSLVNQIGGASEIKYYKCDVTLKDEVQKTIASIKEDFGKIDIAILNSGVSYRSGVLDFDSSKAEITYNTNVLGPIYFIEELLPDFIKNKNGYIVGVSSLADGKGFPKSGFYASSKAAFTIFLESLRIELKKYNVKVITVKPGFVRTAMTDKNEFEMPFLMNVEKAVRIIIKGLKKDKRIIEFPWQTAIGAKILKIIPTKLFELLASKELKPRTK
ncbi:MAG: SDR family NAD(P)-dependent oxidoreductase [Ignavibacteriaceae bacterium]|jgi:short-subunit dehydrogenase|nr:SDR family NAD(P)-dependent oxidoreductase [Ignavibacteriaceae bacterium]